MVVTSSSRSGAHVTLAFTVHSDSDEPLEQGSYGVGLCLEAGLSTSCRSDPSTSMGVTVIINGHPSDEELQREVLLECIPLFEKEEVTCIPDGRAANTIIAMHRIALLLTTGCLGRVSALSSSTAKLIFLRIIMYCFVNLLKFRQGREVVAENG